jgi:uncharacterized membrane protein YecN with MAPEG domain
MTAPNPATKRTRTTRKKPGTGATAAEFLFFLVVVAATYVYQAFVWLLILLGTILLVASIVLTVGGVPEGEGQSALATGAIGLGLVAVGVVLLLVMMRRFGYRFWDTIPFLPGPSGL